MNRKLSALRTLHIVSWTVHNSNEVFDCANKVSGWPVKYLAVCLAMSGSGAMKRQLTPGCLHPDTLSTDAAGTKSWELASGRYWHHSRRDIAMIRVFSKGPRGDLLSL